MTGRLSIVGLGPDGPAHRTAQAEQALAHADVLLGYAPYLARLEPRLGQLVLPTDNREELRRACDALERAADGAHVALVSSGDPGVFAMASAVMEAIETGHPRFRRLDVEIIPGVTAMLAAASRLGAPLGHDFCALSLSDNLKPWPTVLARLEAAAGAGFVVAIYNPVSNARPWQLDAAFAHLKDRLAATLPVAFIRAACAPDETVHLTTLADSSSAHADMRTLVLIGTTESRVIERPGLAPLLYAPRRATSQASAP